MWIDTFFSQRAVTRKLFLHSKNVLHFCTRLRLCWFPVNILKYLINRKLAGMKLPTYECINN